MNKNIPRRNFLKGVVAGSAGLTLMTPGKAFGVEKYRFKMATSWPPKMPILQEAPERFAAQVEEATGGRVSIKVFAAGELIPALGVFDAVSQGTIEIAMSAPYYWAGKSPAAQFFSSIPFGLDSLQFQTWLIAGGGQELWEEIYAPFNLLPMSLGNTGAQMGGWFRKEIKSVADLKGLKIRMPGLGGKALAHLGANVVLMSGGEIYTALERGTIDATEWISPFHDERLGLHRAAKFYYSPGWHEPQSNLELIFHSPSFSKLPKDIQAIIRATAAEVGQWCHLHSEAANGPALERLKTKHRVQVKSFPDEVLKALQKSSHQVLDEIAAKDETFKKVYASYSAFRKQYTPWADISSTAYARALSL